LAAYYAAKIRLQLFIQLFAAFKTLGGALSTVGAVAGMNC
jgi:hypothetical protein